MTTEDLHGYERLSAPPALLPPICMVIPDHSSFSVLRETLMTFAYSHFKKLKCYFSSTTIDLLNAISSEVNGISFGSSLSLRLSPNCVVEKCEAIDRE
jgi:hypothetical protein